MEFSSEHLNELQLGIQRNFELSTSEDSSQLKLNVIKDKLTKLIHYMINKDFNRLLSIFYRIDLNEREVSIILTTAPPDEIPSLLADLVIERELKKAKTRLRYKNQNGD